MKNYAEYYLNKIGINKDHMTDLFSGIRAKLNTTIYQLPIQWVSNIFTGDTLVT